MKKTSAKSVSKKRLAVKVGGLVLAAIGLINLAVALALSLSFTFVVVVTVLLVIGLACMASPQAVVSIIEMLLSWLP